jgi:GTP-binding protein HflX
MKGYYREHGFEHIVFISATARENIDQLKAMLFEEVKRKHITIYPNYLPQGYSLTGDEWKENSAIES